MDIRDKVVKYLHGKVADHYGGISKNATTKSGIHESMICRVSKDGSMAGPNRLICFGWMRSNNDYKSFEEQGITHIGFMSHHATRLFDEHMELSNYIFHESPWSHIFDGCSWEQYLTDGVVLIDVADKPTNQLFGGLIALRNASEHWYNGSTIMFSKLVEAGVNKDIAFLLKHCSSASEGFDDKTFKFDDSCMFGWTAGQESDQSALISSKMSKKQIKNFVAHKFVGNPTAWPYVNNITSIFGQRDSGEPPLVDIVRSCAILSVTKSTNIFKQKQQLSMVKRPLDQAIAEGVMIANNLEKFINSKCDKVEDINNVA